MGQGSVKRQVDAFLIYTYTILLALWNNRRRWLHGADDAFSESGPASSQDLIFWHKSAASSPIMLASSK